MISIYKYYNQNHYATVPYPSPSLPKATVKSGGCGVVCAAMIVSNLTPQTVDPKAMASYVIKRGARVPGGTNMDVLARALCADHGLEHKTTSDEGALLKHLQAGGMAVANVGGNRPGYTGVFSDSGHYIVVAGLTESGRVIVLDPGYYSGKFGKPGRTGKVTVIGNNCICDLSVLAKDTANRTPAYWLFAKKEVARVVEPWKINLMKEAEKAGLIDPKSNHEPEDVASKWFVLAVAMNLLKIIRGNLN